MMSRGFMNLVAGMLLVGMTQEVVLGQLNQGISTPAARYFAGRNLGDQVLSIQTASPVPGTYMTAPPSGQLPGSKPFQNIQYQPTLSPYLGLDAVPESSTGLPNYYLFVQPQMQQRAANEAQSRDRQRLRKQVRIASARGMVSQNPTGGVPTAGANSQFLNTGGYFPAPR